VISPTTRFVSLHRNCKSLTFPARDTICFPVGSMMPRHDAGLASTESHCGAAQSDRYLIARRLSIARQRCLSALPDRSPGSVKMPERRTGCARWRTASSATFHVRRTSSMRHSRKSSGMPKASILRAGPPAAGSRRSSATRRSRCWRTPGASSRRVEQHQRQARLDAAADGLAAAGTAMQSIDRQPVNVNVTCTFGCR
jgi:hypothetical protein